MVNFKRRLERSATGHVESNETAPHSHEFVIGTWEVDPFLKRQSRSQLQNARRGAAKGSGRSDLSKSGESIVDIRVGDRKLRMVQHVKGLDAKLQIDAITHQRSGLGQGDVKIRLVRSAQEIPGQAIRALRWIAHRVED